ncbi:MAG TPA: 5'/3'-nucleotidase SurE [Flavobacteriales bacterium]|nr:5'/3'-nucleotidase SurE [Flavobacteriales bacterium]
MNKPLILVTNDDGITARGIASLVEAVKSFGDLVVIAPDKPQSGMGHAITVNNLLRLDKAEVFAGTDCYACSGTPVDCVKLAIYHVMHRKPDLVVSGVNHGSNASTNVLYSGTMSAAVEGALEGIPAIGFSLCDHRGEADFEASKQVIKKVVTTVLDKKLPENVCLNVNIPKGKPGDIKGLKICRQAKAFWDDKFDRRQDMFGRDYFWLTGEFRNYDGGEDTDIWALNNNYVSVVPIQFDMTAYHALSHLHYWNNIE